MENDGFMTLQQVADLTKRPYKTVARHAEALGLTHGNGNTVLLDKEDVILLISRMIHSIGAFRNVLKAYFFLFSNCENKKFKHVNNSDNGNVLLDVEKEVSKGLMAVKYVIDLMPERTKAQQKKKARVLSHLVKMVEAMPFDGENCVELFNAHFVQEVASRYNTVTSPHVEYDKLYHEVEARYIPKYEEEDDELLLDSPDDELLLDEPGDTLTIEEHTVDYD